MGIRAQQETIRPGYKQTEVGVIPDDWQPKVIGDVVSFSGGSQPPRSTFSATQKNGYLRLIQIRDYKTDEFATYIPESLVNKRCSANDIMIGRYGPPIFQILRGLEGAYNVALIKAIPSALIDREYLFHFLKQDSLFRFVEALSQRSSGQTGIEMPALKGYGLPLPSLPEQRAIAAALSDVDESISTLDKLIAKKRNLKQAAMQQLLTGKRRLPSFSGEWEVKRLWEECGLITKGTTPTSLGKDFTSSGINFIKIETLEENGNVIKEKVAFIDEETNNLLKRSQLREKDILVSIAGALGRIAIVSADILPANTNQALAIVRLKASSAIDHAFLFHYLHIYAIKKHIEAINVQGAQANLSLKNVGDFIVSIPSLPEQVAIAAALSDMDTEITALEQKRDKTRALKQGIVQELLTGKTRLI